MVHAQQFPVRARGGDHGGDAAVAFAYPEAYADLPGDNKELDTRIAEALGDHPANDELLAAVVLAIVCLVRGLSRYLAALALLLVVVPILVVVVSVLTGSGA